MQLPTLRVSANLKCLCRRDGGDVWIDIRMKVKGNKGSHTVACWNCQRLVKLEARGLSNIQGYAERAVGSQDWQTIMTDVIWKKLTYD